MKQNIWQIKKTEEKYARVPKNEAEMKLVDQIMVVVKIYHGTKHKKNKNACSLLDMTINCRCRGEGGGGDIRQAKEQKVSKHMFEAMSKMNGKGVVAWNGQQKLNIKTNGNMTIKSPLTSQLKQLTIDGRGERITTLQKIRSIKSAVKLQKWKGK